MTNLSKLTVSLTKHGAHKLAPVIIQFDKDEILNNLDGGIPGVKVEAAQAKKNLSAYQGNVPQVWQTAKEMGEEYVNSLVLIGIIFSHHKLIKAMQQSSERSMYCGSIERKNQLDEKYFTNFAHILEELGFVTNHTKDKVSYNLESIFALEGFSQLAKTLLQLKLKKANWDGKNDIVEEMIRLNFHDVFSIKPDAFQNWLEEVEVKVEVEVEPTLNNTGSFNFKKGHNTRKTGSTNRKKNTESGRITFKHNAIQNKLFAQLVAEYGEDYVGTEIETGQGTFIDLVLKTDELCWFYEIKTAQTVKACVREAIPQLLEYAYWKSLNFDVGRLIIVAELSPDPEAEEYLKILREKFGLNLYYQQFKDTVEESQA